MLSLYSKAGLLIKKENVLPTIAVSLRDNNTMYSSSNGDDGRSSITSHGTGTKARMCHSVTLIVVA